MTTDDVTEPAPQRTLGKAFKQSTTPAPAKRADKRAALDIKGTVMLDGFVPGQDLWTCGQCKHDNGQPFKNRRLETKK